MPLHTRGYRGEVDLFVVYCADNERTYAVPADHVTETAGSLRLTPPVNGQVKGIRWARDYDLAAAGVDRIGAFVGSCEV